MSCQDITVIQDTQPIVVLQNSNAIQVMQVNEVIHMCAQNPVSQFLPFYFVATQGQTVFTLPAIALAAWVAINGTEQSAAKTPTPDFTIDETTLTLSSGVDAGDTVFGMIQVA